MRFAPGAAIVLRSDVPVGYTARVRNRYPELDIAFVPDFGREGRALQDAFEPSRIIIGGGSPELQKQIEKLLGGSCEVVHTDSDEAESVKLFANAYLAMRVAYFNELDTYAELRGLDAQAIIRSVSLDPRIGDLYNNPSFGYGGRYLVEGTCRLRNDFADIPEAGDGGSVQKARSRSDGRSCEYILCDADYGPDAGGLFGAGGQSKAVGDMPCGYGSSRDD